MYISHLAHMHMKRWVVLDSFNPRGNWNLGRWQDCFWSQDKAELAFTAGLSGSIGFAASTVVEDPHECGSICHQLHFSGARKSRTVFKTPSMWVSWVSAILESEHKSERSKNPFPLAQGAIDLSPPWVSASQILPRAPSPCPRLQGTGDLGALLFWALECSLPLQGIATWAPELYVFHKTNPG